MIRTEMLEVLREKNMKKTQTSDRREAGEEKKSRLQQWLYSRQKKGKKNMEV